MNSNTIYLPLKGRIGNQLFEYACARAIQLKMPKDTKIIIDDSEVLKCNWQNSLKFYNLPNVEYIHENLVKNSFLSRQFILRSLYKLLSRKKDYVKKFEIEKKYNNFFNSKGMFFCENGYNDHVVQDFGILCTGSGHRYFV